MSSQHEVVSYRTLSIGDKIVLELTAKDGTKETITLTAEEAEDFGNKLMAGADLAEQGRTPIIRMGSNRVQYIGPNVVDLGSVSGKIWKSRSKKNRKPRPK